MRDLYLRFDDEDAWRAAGIERDPGLLEIDEVGTVTVTRKGAPVELPGYHVNVRCADDRGLSALDEHQVFPAKPLRVWL